MSYRYKGTDLADRVNWGVLATVVGFQAEHRPEDLEEVRVTALGGLATQSPETAAGLLSFLHNHSSANVRIAAGRMCLALAGEDPNLVTGVITEGLRDEETRQNLAEYYDTVLSQNSGDIFGQLSLGNLATIIDTHRTSRTSQAALATQVTA